VVTLTVTEAGYAPGSAVLEHLTRALAARRDLGLSPLALVSCDNLHANGEVLRDHVLGLADRLDPELPLWIECECAFVSTSVDRITPRTTDADRALVTQELEIRDAVPVVCEPFSDWVLSGDFPAGRPRWEDAGARFVADVQPWELRKLWLLNGAHSLLAYLGLLRGHATVADAIADPRLRDAVESFWNLAQRHLPDAAALELTRYREQLLERFANARIGYPLTQIASDGLAKLRNRVVPVIDAALRAGEPVAAVTPALHVVSAWIVWLSRQDLSLDLTPRLDADIGEIRAATARAGAGDPTAALIELLAPAWNRNPELLAALAGLRDQPLHSIEESRP
jgi:fructuronate reductase